MSSQMVTLTLVLHACPASKTEETERILGRKPTWSQQPLLLGSVRTEIDLRLTVCEAEELIASLARFGNLYLDIVMRSRSGSTMFMIVPGLGIFRAETNQLGEILISEERILAAVEASSGNFRELARLLRLSIGQTWDDVLDPFRAARYSDNLELITKAV